MKLPHFAFLFSAKLIKTIPKDKTFHQNQKMQKATAKKIFSLA